MKSIYFFCIILIFYSCNVESIRKSRLQNTAEKQQSTQVDSFLYYQPVVLKDPFLDSLKVQYDSEQNLKVRVVPAPPDATPKVKQVQGYRVQTFAGIDSVNAVVMVNNLKTILNDSVYFLKENELFKVQLGDYLYRNDADMKVLDLRKDGFSSAWVVQRLINTPVNNDSSADSTESAMDRPFKIQILVTSDQQKAKSLVNQLKNQFNLHSDYIQANNLYKVFLGSFINREEAQKVLEEVRQKGYNDAWVVQNK